MFFGLLPGSRNSFEIGKDAMRNFFFYTILKNMRWISCFLLHPLYQGRNFGKNIGGAQKNSLVMPKYLKFKNIGGTTNTIYVLYSSINRQGRSHSKYLWHGKLRKSKILGNFFSYPYGCFLAIVWIFSIFENFPGGAKIEILDFERQILTDFLIFKTGTIYGSEMVSSPL